MSQIHSEDEGAASFMSSNGLRLRPKIVRFYEEVLLKGTNPTSDSLGFDFLLLTPHENTLYSCFKRLGPAQIAAIKGSIQYLFEQCVNHIESKGLAIDYQSIDPASDETSITVSESPLSACSGGLSGCHVVMMNSLRTLSTLFSCLLDVSYSRGDIGSLLHTLWGMEQDKVDKFFLRVISACTNLIIDQKPLSLVPVPPIVQDAALRVLLSLTSAMKIHQNLFLDFFRVHGTFGHLFEHITFHSAAASICASLPSDSAAMLKSDPSPKAASSSSLSRSASAELSSKVQDPATAAPQPLPTPILIKIAAILSTCLHYRKYETRNPAVERITQQSSTAELEALNETIAVIFRCARIAQESAERKEIEAQQSALSWLSSTVTTLPSQVTSTLSFLPQVVALPARAFGFALGYGSTPPPAHFTPVSTPSPSAGTPFKPSDSASVASAGSSASSAVSEPPPLRPDAGADPKLLEDARALAWYSRACESLALYLLFSVLANAKFVVKTARLRRELTNTGADGMGRAVTILPTMCPVGISSFLTAASFMLGQEPSARNLMMCRMCLIILRLLSEDSGSNILLHDTTLKTTVDILLKPDSNSISHPPQSVPSTSNWTRSKPTDPLVCVVFKLLADFISAHSTRLSSAAPVLLSCLVVCLDTIHRLLCFQIQMQSRAGVLSSAGVPVVRHASVSTCVLSLSRVLVKILCVCGRCKNDLTWRRMKPIALQTCRLVRALLSLREDLFASDEDANGFVYELARCSQELNSFYHASQRRKEASVCSEMSPICEVALTFASKVDLFQMSKGASSVTAEEVIALIEREKGAIKLERINMNQNYARFVENSGQSDGETTFFDLFVNETMSDFHSLFVSAYNSSFAFARQMESPDLRMQNPPLSSFKPKSTVVSVSPSHSVSSSPGPSRQVSAGSDQMRTNGLHHTDHDQKQPEISYDSSPASDSVHLKTRTQEGLLWPPPPKSKFRTPS